MVAAPLLSKSKVNARRGFASTLLKFQLRGGCFVLLPRLGTFQQVSFVLLPRLASFQQVYFVVLHRLGSFQRVCFSSSPKFG